MRKFFTHYPKRIVYSKWPDPINGLLEELEKVDLILVTHHHKDHCKNVTIKRISLKKTVVMAPIQCTKELGEDIRVVKTGDEIDFRDIKIKVVDAYNTKQGSSTKKIHHKGNGVGYLVTLKGKTIYRTEDTDYIPEMKMLGSVDVALLPIGGKFTMDAQEALKAAIAIKPRIVIPMHNYDADPERFKENVEIQSDVEVIPLQIGQGYNLN